MKKQKNRFIYVTFIATLVIIIGLGVKGYQLKGLIKRVENQIEIDQKALAKEQEELQKLQDEVTQINTPEYIEKVAREQLGMVKQEDIIFKEK